MQSIGKQITGTKKAYDSAMNKLSEGKGALITKAKSLKTLGLTVTKALPQEFLNNDEERLI